ncbi:hypothetical protein KY067_002548 [Listeria monocytogenes]|nr:hypothetical protein [Listeria monocytogenes]
MKMLKWGMAIGLGVLSVTLISISSEASIVTKNSEPTKFQDCDKETQAIIKSLGFSEENDYYQSTYVDKE